MTSLRENSPRQVVLAIGAVCVSARVVANTGDTRAITDTAPARFGAD